LRVLYFIDSLVPGGAEQSLVAIAPEYVARGISLDVAVLHDRLELRAKLEQAGAEVFSLSGRWGRCGRTARARELVTAQHPDLVHTTLFEADQAGRIAAQLSRTPVVSSLVNVAYGPDQLTDANVSWWKVKAARLLDATTARVVTRFHAISEHVAVEMGRRLRLPQDRIEVVPRGRDPKALGARTDDRRARIRAELGVHDDAPLLLGVGRQEWQKGFDILLDAFRSVVAHVPRARLVIAGREGNQTSRLRDALHQFGFADAVRFLGVRADVPDLLCGADVFALPSRWEGLGSVLLEAMALEAPIVATDLPAVQEVLQDGHTASLVPSGDPTSMASALIRTLTDRSAAANTAAAARRSFLNRFTIDRVADQMVSFYDNALSRTRPEIHAA
jgi:glycosyltransferase involved in cell wall biosynthesis